MFNRIRNNQKKKKIQSQLPEEKETAEAQEQPIKTEQEVQEQSEEPVSDEEKQSETDSINLQDSQPEPEDEEKVVHLKRRRTTPYIILAAVLLAAVGIGVYFYSNKTFTSYEVDTKMDRTDETAMQYLSFQGGFVKYNVDGITYEDKTGTIIWTEAFTMAQPKVVTRGEYVAVTDIGNNQYTLYNAKKKIGTFTTDYPITDIQLAHQGLVAVVLEDEKKNYIVA